MTQKEYVIKVLDLIKDSFPLAEGLIYLISNNEVDQNLLKTLIDSFEKSIKEIKNEKSKEILLKSTNILKNIQNEESIEFVESQQDLKDLENMLKNI